MVTTSLRPPPSSSLQLFRGRPITALPIHEGVVTDGSVEMPSFRKAGQCTYIFLDGAAGLLGTTDA